MPVEAGSQLEKARVKLRQPPRHFAPFLPDSGKQKVYIIGDMPSERSEATRDSCKGQVDGFPANLVAAAIRHEPYKNSANAIAEIVDKSYDAHATEVHVAIVCGADSDQPHPMAVLDNSVGMDKDALRHCIQYGTHQPIETSRERLGKFGVGLPILLTRISRPFATLQ